MRMRTSSWPSTGPSGSPPHDSSRRRSGCRWQRRRRGLLPPPDAVCNPLLAGGRCMKLVRVPGRYVSYPPVCACCLAKATHTLEVRKEDLKALAVALTVGAMRAAGGQSAAGAGSLRDSRAANVPYCPSCSGHVRWKRSGGWLGVVLHVPVNAFFGLLLGFIVAALVGAAGIGGAVLDLDHPNWFIVAAFVGGGVALALMNLRWRPQGPLGRLHAREADGLEIARFTGSEVVLRCHNDRFAEKLRQANPGAAFATGA